jgi:septal ring factor EnvC (AmiA/AmiB activator)
MNLRIFSHIKPLAFVPAVCCLILANAIPVFPVSPPKNTDEIPVQVHRLETELSKEKQKYQLFHIKEKELLSRLSVLEKEVAEKRVQLSSLQEEVRHSASVIKSLEKEKGTFENALRATESELMERLVALYKYARRGYMKIIATAGGFDEFRLRVKYLKSIMQEDRRVLEALVVKKEEQEAKIAVLRGQLSMTKATMNQSEKSLASLRKDLEEKVILLMKTHKEKEFYQTAITELEAGAERLKDTLLNLDAKPVIFGEQASSFIKEKGLLPLPLDGGRVLEGKDVLGDAAARIRRGIYVESRSDNAVRCTFPGKVAFSGSLKGYGETVIVNHGSRFFTIFAELQRRLKKKDDPVKRGEPIGLAGDQKGSGVHRLYFEIRHGETILNTAKWLKAR